MPATNVWKSRKKGKRKLERRGSVLSSDVSVDESENSDSTQNKPEILYNEGDKIICYHGSQPYMAKCLKYRIKNSAVEYFIHYSGWNKSWDQWVGADRILECTEENMSILGDDNKKKSRGRSSINIPSRSSSPAVDSNTTSISAGKNQSSVNVIKDHSAETTISTTTVPTVVRTVSVQNATSTVTSESSSSIASIKDDRNISVKRKHEVIEWYSTFHDLKLILPSVVLTALKKDAFTINIEKKLHKIPMVFSVNDITDSYVQARANHMQDKQRLIIPKEFARGIKHVFNIVCLTKLLYQQERTQYLEFEKKNHDITPSSVYGIIHLFRLFTKLGGLLRYVPMHRSCLPQVQMYAIDYMKYLIEIKDQYPDKFVSASTPSKKKTNDF